MTAKTRVAFIALALSVFALSWASAQAPDPLAGVWQLNTAKSKSSQGPPPSSTATTISESGGIYTFRVRSEPAAGQVNEWSFTTRFDGKPSKVTGNNPNADTVTYTRVDARTYDAVSSKGGKETVRQHVVHAADGKSRTMTTTGTDGSGRKVDSVSIFDRK